MIIDKMTPSAKRIVLAGIAVVLIVGLALVGYLTWIVGSLDTPRFHAALLQRIEGAAGASVRAERIEISLLSGATLRGVAVANPRPFSGDLLTADELSLRYQWRPLLARRFQVDRLALARPKLSIAMDAQGNFNYQRLGRRAAGDAPRGAEAASLAALPLRIVLSNLSIRDGSVGVTDATGAPLVALDGATLDSGLDLAAGRASGQGTLAVAVASIGARVRASGLSARLALAEGSLRFAPIDGRLAEGRITGEATVRFEKDFGYTAAVRLKGARVEALLREAGSTTGASGTLEGDARFAGTAGLATLRGRGQARVADCRVDDNRTLRLLASVLGIPELASPDLDECRVEFVQVGSRVTTPVLSLKGKAVELGGKGALDLATNALDYDLTLALAPRLFAKISRRELRGAFRTRADGFATIDFHLSGTTLEPRTDLLARIGRGAAEHAIQEGLRRLFGDKRR